MTIKELAELAGLSVGTVSMSLNNNPMVSEDTKEKVLKLAKEHNYVINQSAKRLSTNKSGLIGVIVTKNNNPFFANFVYELDRAITDTEYTMLLGFSGNDVNREERLVDTFISNQVEGIIIVPSDKIQNCSHLNRIKDLRIPLVFSTTAYKDFENDVVMTDLEHGEYILVDYLLKRGYRSIVFVNGNSSMMHFRLRLWGYIKAFKDNGLKHSDNCIFETIPDYESGYNLVEKVLEQKPDVIITANDYLAFGIMKKLEELNYDIPNDIAVAGYDDLQFSNLISHPLTTIRQPVKDIAQQSLNYLIDKIKNQKQESEGILLEPKLIIRSSTK